MNIKMISDCYQNLFTYEVGTTSFVRTRNTLFRLDVTMSYVLNKDLNEDEIKIAT